MRHFLKNRAWGLGAFFIGFFAFHAAATTYYVDINSPNPTAPYTSWSTAATNIQNAISLTANGDLVLVNPGVYTAPNGASATVVVTNAVTVQGVNGPSTTFINGNGVMPGVYLQNGSVLLGFTITNGNGYPNGGGIYCQSAACVVSNCVITGNSCYGNGGGAYQGTLLNCALINNSTWQDYEAIGGGGAYQATLVNCMVLNNFTYNSGGGVANSLIYQSLIVSNEAYGGYGGGVYDCTNFSSAIAGNIANTGDNGQEGGGAYGGILVNCTVTANSSINGGGTANCIQTNCIIYYNQGNNNYSNWFYSDTFSYCCTMPNPGGLSNITSPPALASISHISLNSPCRGAGNPAAANGVDIDGNPWNSPLSIGCSELYPGNNFGNLTAAISVPFTNWDPGYPLNFQANITGPAYNSVWNFGDGTLATNQPYISHTWAATGSYPVTLTAYNDGYPAGVIATQTMTVAVPTIYYVSANSLNPTPPYSSWSIAATNIQDAVSVAPPGSLVLVLNTTNGLLFGRYSYPTNLPAIYQSPGSGIQAPGPTSPYYYSVVITNPVTVQSVNGPSNTWIAGPPNGGGGCVYLANGAALSGFILTNVYSAGSRGIYCASTNAIITNCVIKHSSYVGAYLGTLYNCILTANGGGTVGSTMFNCVISNNSAAYGGGTYGGILNNSIIVNNSGEYGGGAYGGIFNNCLIVSNTATYGGGVFSSSNYPAVLNNCFISNNTALYGGGIYNSNSFTNCILSNCTITRNAANPSEGYGGGTFNAELNNCLVNSNSAEYGGGVSGGLINNCAIANNSAGGGGGVFGGTLTGFPIVTTLAVLNNCLISNNFAANGGGAFGTPSFTNCTLNNCVIAGNTGNRGGGVYDSWVKNCVVSSNAANEYEGGGADYSILINCAVTTNSSPGNGGGASYSTLTNCLLAVNQALNGGAAYECLLVDCTVVSNSSPACGGTEASTNYDCLIYDNLVRPSVLTPNYNGGVFAYCDTTPLPPGTRNISVDPQLVNLGGANYQLQPNSPCINSGNNAYINTPTDLAGNPRIVGGTVDIGAYEYQSPTSVISYAYLQQYGLPTDGSVDYADLDGTAFNVYQDWAAGLNPTNSASVLAMLIPAATNNAHGITVSWQSVSGIPYLLQRSTNLPGFVTIQSNLIGQTNITSYADTSATNNFPYLYRVGVTVP